MKGGPSVIDQPDHPILQRWLGGSTCSNSTVRRSVLFESETHIILRHYAHASYCGRMYGSKNCEAYAALYLKADFATARPNDRIWMLGSGHLKQWAGRLSRARVLDDCKDMGISFNDGPNGLDI